MKAPNGFSRYDWSITYTVDSGKSWSTELLETRRDAAEFLRSVLLANDGNGGFSYYANRHTLVNPADLLDDSLDDVRVRLIIGRHLVGIDGAQGLGDPCGE